VLELPIIFFMKAYSVDLRERVLAACNEGATEKETAERFALSLTSVQRYKRHLRERGCLQPLPIPGRPKIIKKEQEEDFLALVASKTDWTLDTLGDAWKEKYGVKPTVSVLSDTCKRLKVTRKKSPA
jgi:transposase